jgi:hypothetical protein
MTKRRYPLRRETGTAADDVQPVTANVNQVAWREEPARGRPFGRTLVEHARRDQRGERGNDQGQLLDVRGAR